MLLLSFAIWPRRRRGPTVRASRGRTRYRLRELGIVVGELPTGRHNAITDVSGVTVGYKTLIFDRPGPPPNLARTGVTIIVPREEPIWRNHRYAGAAARGGRDLGRPDEPHERLLGDRGTRTGGRRVKRHKVFPSDYTPG
ncbi:MAG: hypothetical protein GEV11_29270 [Streptosporangiales bacterium]|nr:hypothetical protein [Streptosporangiales bacterium]